MNKSHFPIAPQRLLESDDSAGRALRQRQNQREGVVAVDQTEAQAADSAQRAPAIPPFAELAHEQKRRARAHAAAALLSAAAVIGAFGLARQVSPLSTEAEALLSATISAEPDPAVVDESQSLPAEKKQSVAEHAKLEAPIASAAASSSALPTAGKHSVLRPNAALRPNQLAHPQPRLAAAEVGSKALDCSQLSATGKHAEALACFARQRESSGIRGELAYLEQARLQQSALHDADAALASILTYQARYPQGILKPEATLAQIRLLVQLGRGKEARATIHTASEQMPEKAALLRELAVDLAVAEARCGEARALLQKIPAEQATPDWKQKHLGNCWVP